MDQWVDQADRGTRWTGGPGGPRPGPEDQWVDQVDRADQVDLMDQWVDQVDQVDRRT